MNRKIINHIKNVISKIGLKYYIKKGVKKYVINNKDFWNIYNGEVNSTILNFKDGFKIYCERRDINCVIETCILRQYSKPQLGDIVVDLGGHIGSFSILASNFAKKIYVYEIDTRNRNIIDKNIKLNGLNNIIVMNYGLYDKNGSVNVKLGDSSGCNSISKYGSLKCEVKNVYEEFKKFDRIDYLKIDVEGAEYKILPNLSVKPTLIEGEFHIFNDGNDFNTLKNILFKDYNVNYKFPYMFIAKLKNKEVARDE